MLGFDFDGLNNFALEDRYSYTIINNWLDHMRRIVLLPCSVTP